MGRVPNKSKFKTKGEMYPLLKQGIVTPPTGASVANGAAVPVVNSAGTAVAGTHTATVAGSTLTNVKLAATVATVANASTFPGVTGTGTTATFTVANGVITGIVLS